LIVEDDEILREGLRTGLMLEGLVADSVETIADARLAVSLAAYDVVVSRHCLMGQASTCYESGGWKENSCRFCF
jgi:DNA-binding NtrC family response regulator